MERGETSNASGPLYYRAFDAESWCSFSANRFR